MRAQPSDLTQLAAVNLVESRGTDALRVLRERAELSEELGHRVAAMTWRQMLGIAARLIEGANAGVAIERRARPPDLHPSIPRAW